MPQIIKHTEQCKVVMQIAWLKLKLFDYAADSGYLHVNVKRNGELNCHKTGDSFSSYITAAINSFKLIKIYMDNIS